MLFSMTAGVNWFLPRNHQLIPRQGAKPTIPPPFLLSYHNAVRLATKNGGSKPPPYARRVYRSAKQNIMRKAHIINPARDLYRSGRKKAADPKGGAPQ